MHADIDIVINFLSKNDVKKVTDLYFEYFYEDGPFQPVLSRANISGKLMEHYFESIGDSRNNFILTAKFHDELIGFISLIKNDRDIYLNLIKNHLLSLLFLLAYLLITKGPIIIKLLLNKINFIFNNGSKSIDKTLPETNTIPELSKEMYKIRPMLVITEFQGTSVAKDLIISAEKILKTRGEESYRLQVLESNKRAINFYNKVGFSMAKEQGNYFYMIKKISDKPEI